MYMYLTQIMMSCLHYGIIQYVIWAITRINVQPIRCWERYNMNICTILQAHRHNHIITTQFLQCLYDKEHILTHTDPQQQFTTYNGKFADKLYKHSISYFRKLFFYSENILFYNFLQLSPMCGYFQHTPT